MTENGRNGGWWSQARLLGRPADADCHGTHQAGFVEARLVTVRQVNQWPRCSRSVFENRE